MTPAEWLEAWFDIEYQRRPRRGGAGRFMLALKDDASGFEQFSASARWPEPYRLHLLEDARD